MTGARGRSILGGAVYGFLSWSGPLLLSLVVTPQLILGLGLENYGLYSLVMGFVAFSTNISFTRALTRYISEFRASERESEIADLITSTIVIVLGLGVAALSVIVIASEPLASRLVSGELQQSTTAHGLVVGAMIVAVTLMSQVFGAVMQGYEQFKLFSLTACISNGGTLIVNLALVKLGYGFNEVLFGTLVTGIVGAGIGFIAARRAKASKLIAAPKMKFVQLILGYSKHVVGYQLLGYFVLLFERLRIASILGPEALSLYVVPLVIGIQFLGLINSITLFLFPMMSAGQVSDESLRKLYDTAVKAIFAGACVALAVTVWHGHSFLELWIGREFADGAARVFIFQLVGFSALAVSVVPFHAIEGAGKPAVNLSITGAVSFVSVILMVFPLMGSGIESFAVARMIGFCLWIPGIAIIERILFGSVSVKGWLLRVSQVALAIACFSLIAYLTGPLMSLRWLGLIISIILECSIALLVLWRLRYFDDIIPYIRQSN